MHLFQSTLSRFVLLGDIFIGHKKLYRVSAPGGGAGGDPPGTATAADGTHPTGMYSCSLGN